MSERTLSETIFEQFCNAHRIRYDRVETDSAGGVKTPDYDVFLDEQKVITEVKQIDPNSEERRLLEQLRVSDWASMEWHGDPAARVRNKISDAMPQISARAEGQYPSILVLYNNTPMTPYNTEPYSVLTALYGREASIIELTRDLNQEPRLVDVRFGNKQKVGRDFNTSLSAVAVMYRTDDSTIKLDVYHNTYARIPLNPERLRHPNVKHFAVQTNADRRFQGWAEI